MRNIPGYPTDTDVLEPVVRVVHGGRDRQVQRLSLSRELPSSFHAQVAGVGGLTQATGSVDWAPLTDVVEAHLTAFNRIAGWPPRNRDPVAVYTGYRTSTGDLLAKQLTGSIAGSSGDPQEGHSSKLVDPIARLSRKVTLPPLLNNMPPLTEGGPWRGVGLYPTYFTDLAARAGSFCSTPPMAGGCVFSAPLMGGAWPERGTLVTGLRNSDRNNANAVWNETSWGMGVSDAFLTYTPSGNSALDRTMEVTLLAEVASGDCSVSVAWGDTALRLSRTAGSAYAWLDTAGGTTQICALGGAPSPISMRVSPNGGTLQVELRNAAGTTTSGSVNRPATSGNANQVRVSSATTATIGGAQVSFPPTAWASVGYTRTAYITPAAHNVTLAASPPIMGVTAKTLLEDQSRAELAALWIDGDGSLHWMNRNRLTAGTSSTILTSRDHLKSLPWEEDFASVSSTVEVTSRQVGAINQFKHPRQEVWRSNYSKVEADGTEVFEELLHPDADEDWIMIDTSFNNDYVAANEMRGSDMGLYFFLEKGEPNQAGYTTTEGYERAWAGASLQQIDHRTYKLVTRVYAVSAAGWDEYEFSLKIPTERQMPGQPEKAWPANLGGLNFPVIRAYAKVMWTDTTYTAASGAWDAPVLTHDVGWWVQDPAECQRIANLLAAQTSTPRPFLNSVSVVPDARLQLGDIVTLSDPDLTGIEFRCLVVGIEDSINGAPLQWEQSCSFRVLDYMIISTTLGEFDTAWAGQLLTALDIARANETLAQLDAQPLKGAPQ